MSEDKRPNIVFVFGDQWRAQALGCAGDINCHTPNIDGFSGESLYFPNAVAGLPVCCPYRASLMTGQYPLTHGVFINDVELSPDCTSIANAFSANGYNTAYIGKWHLYGSPDGRHGRRNAFVPRDYQLGFDYWKGFECTHDYNNSNYFFNSDPVPHAWEGYDAFSQSRDAAEYIRMHANAENPFLLMLSWGPPHFPLHSAPGKYREMYEDREIVLRPNVPSSQRDKAKKDLRGYYAHIAALDDCFKIVYDAIEEAGIADNTIFIMTSDHGDMGESQGLPMRMKLMPFEESVRVPFYLRWPKLSRSKNAACMVPFDAPDIMPTLLGLAGFSAPPTVEGCDWSAVIRGEKELSSDAAALLLAPAEFTEMCRYGIRAYRGLRTSRYTFVRMNREAWLLFDNIEDPFQMKNLVDDPAHAGLMRELDMQLRRRLESMHDEFLDACSYLTQAGLTHYREVRIPLEKVWKSPWR